VTVTYHVISRPTKTSLTSDLSVCDECHQRTVVCDGRTTTPAADDDVSNDVMDEHRVVGRYARYDEVQPVTDCDLLHAID